ncbi:MAG: hypothetical protein WAN47_00780 [Nitrosotalea sp.]
MANEFSHKKICISLPVWQIKMLQEEQGNLSMSKLISGLVNRELMEQRKKRKQD